MNYKCCSSGGFGIDADVEDSVWFNTQFWTLDFQKRVVMMTPDRVPAFMVKYKINHIIEMFYGPCSRSIWLIKDNVFTWAPNIVEKTLQDVETKHREFLKKDGNI